MTINLVAIQKLREQIAEKKEDISNYNEMLNDATEDILYLEYALNELLEPDVPDPDPDDDSDDDDEHCHAGLTDQQIEDLGVAIAVGTGATTDGLRRRIRASILARDVQVPGILNY
tara:strand:+ start:251 stop:598 length:348 start_codon:yes stop_codon:yes gene_type:complete